MADSTKGTEEKEDSSDSDVAHEDDEYSSPSDPCPSPSLKRRKKGDGEEGDKDYIPPKEGPELIRNFHVYLLVGNGATAIKKTAEEKVLSQIDEVPANTTSSKKSERSAKVKKRKRERSVNRKDEGFHVVTHVSPKGEPLAPKTARAKFSSQCGIIVREKIPITVKDWDHVSNGDKEVLWKELKKIFQFPDGSEAAWDDFLTLKNSPEEIQRSQKYAELAKKNKFPHRLGSTGYAPKVEQWTKEEEEMRKKGQPVPMEEWTQRSRNWVRARTPKITDEGKVSFEFPELQSVANKIENLSSSQKKGFFKPKREKDVLSTGLGTPEHGGRVRDVSSKMSWKEGFKHDPHKKREAYKDKLRDEGAAEFERQMMDFCVKHMILPRPETKEPEPDYPFDDLKENTPCRLHIPIGRSGKTLEAAIAIAIPGRTYNEEFIPDAYAKVQPQVVHDGFESYDIDFSTADGVSVLGDAVDLVILWHKNDISFGLGTDATQKPVVPKLGLGKPPRPPKRKVTDKAEEPEMQKENPVPEVPPEIAMPEAAMEIPVSESQKYLKTLLLRKTPRCKRPRSLRRPLPVLRCLECLGATTPKSKDENKERFMVIVFRGGKERAKLRDDDPQKAAELAGPTYFATDDCPAEYEHGKALLPEWALNEVPWEMKRLHTFYMQASKKGLGNITARSPADCFGEEGYVWLDFSYLHAIYRRDKMDVNYVGVWCMMQYIDAKKTKEPIGFLDPTRICQTQHTVSLAPGSDQLKGKTSKEIAEYKKGLHKEKLITVAQYIGRVFLHFQNKRVVLAAYNFNDHYICLLIHPKDGTVVVLDPLDYKHQSYKEFLTILQYVTSNHEELSFAGITLANSLKLMGVAKIRMSNKR
uniref:DUF8039 domain-containing protein n=2 Tax=Oryza sativa subsp. japonica TaxID=39947 RepID=Q10HD6_ORYSJ|nr:hypothetical protein [Oryza sativa Japonica Group]ABF97407.1 transposon protein, putative, CACTA, En/Spm sub-class [Oryza sativa Japonica Group]